jgi:DNA-directed RNA polymerase specialized sigma24 family protein
MRLLAAAPDRRRSGEDDEAVALYAAHRLRLVRLAVLLVDDLQTAEDVVQDAFARFLARRPGLDDQQQALAYLRTSVVNGARDKLRRRRTARAYVPRTRCRATPPPTMPCWRRSTAR